MSEVKIFSNLKETKKNKKKASYGHLWDQFDKEYTNNKIFIDEILYRKHPIVCNEIDNYCNICNIGLYVLDDLDIIRCKHIN